MGPSPTGAATLVALERLPAGLGVQENGHHQQNACNKVIVMGHCCLACEALEGHSSSSNFRPPTSGTCTLIL